MTEHGRDRCGGPAFCVACNTRMIQREGDGLRKAVSDALTGETRVNNPESCERVVARVERYWRDSKKFRERYRVRV